VAGFRTYLYFLHAQQDSIVYFIKQHDSSIKVGITPKLMHTANNTAFKITLETSGADPDSQKGGSK